MALKSNDNDEAISEINVVPLVDIILVVLIIFMVTAPMFLKPTINVNLPKAATGDSTTASQLNITISKEGKMSLNGQSTTEDAIKEKASSEFGKNSDVQAIISADKDTPHGDVVHAIDIIKSTGVKKFGISIDEVK